MHLHEYQAKQILRKYDVPVSDFYVASSMADVESLIRQHQLQEAVLKVQVHAGGRGKAGGVKIAHNQQEIIAAAQELLKKRIINEQTGRHGLVAHQIILTSLIPI